MFLFCKKIQLLHNRVVNSVFARSHELGLRDFKIVRFSQQRSYHNTYIAMHLRTQIPLEWPGEFSTNPSLHEKVNYSNSILATIINRK